MLATRASTYLAPGGGGRWNRHDAGFASPRTFAANVKSCTCPLSSSTVPRVPSRYSTRKAVAGDGGIPCTLMLPTFLRTSPTLTDSLRPSAASRSSQLHFPSSPAFHTSLPVRHVTALTPL